MSKNRVKSSGSMEDFKGSHWYALCATFLEIIELLLMSNPGAAELHALTR